MGLVDGPNLYAYARDNPIRFSDPNGTRPPDEQLDQAQSADPEVARRDAARAQNISEGTRTSEPGGALRFARGAWAEAGDILGALAAEAVTAGKTGLANSEFMLRSNPVLQAVGVAPPSNQEARDVLAEGVRQGEQFGQLPERVGEYAGEAVDDVGQVGEGGEPGGRAFTRTVARILVVRELVKQGLTLFTRKAHPSAEPKDLTSAERKALQAAADEFDTTIDVVGSRAAGEGRGVGTDLPVGKGPGTRSDIDLRIEGQKNIDTGGALADRVKEVSGGAGQIASESLPEIPTTPPYIRFTPRKK